VSLLERRLAWRKLNTQAREAELGVVLLSSFTIDPLVPYLGLDLLELGISADVTVGPFNQIATECMDPLSPTAVSRPRVVIIWPRLEDLWAGYPLPLDSPPELYVEPLIELVEASQHASAWGSTVVFVLPAIPDLRPLGVGDAGNPQGVYATAVKAREAARSRLASTGALIADAELMVRDLGVHACRDAQKFAFARIPYREEAFALAAQMLARLVRLSLREAPKVVAVDADGTLWGGVVGEDGTEGVDLVDNGPGEAYRDFQRYLLELRRAGLLITLASKNNEADVWPVFDRREMSLRRSDLAAWRVNWAPKSTAIEEMAKELNLGSASFVLIDDSPIERAEVEHALPEVTTLEMPEDVASWVVTIAESGVLDRLPPTDEDAARAKSYQQESERRAVRSTSSLEDFLSSLQLVVAVTGARSVDVPRVAQLIAKTNQFTLAGARPSEAEVSAYLKDDGYRVLAASARDRFGDYGIVGAIIGHVDPATPERNAVLDVFVLSCRAMGRGVEDAMLCSAFNVFGGEVYGSIREDPKNIPARDYFASLGLDCPGMLAPLKRPDWPPHIRAEGVSRGEPPSRVTTE
jgi:FkbH-like protein